MCRRSVDRVFLKAVELLHGFGATKQKKKQRWGPLALGEVIRAVVRAAEEVDGAQGRGEVAEVPERPERPHLFPQHKFGKFVRGNL